MKIKSTKWILLIGLMIGTIGFSSVVEASCLTVQCQGFQADFDQVVQYGNEIYCYWDMKKIETGNDYVSLAQSIKSKIDDSTTPTQFYLLMREWAASFNDGHVNFMLTNQGPPIDLSTADVRFDLLAPATSQEKLIVSEAKPQTQLLTGDVVIAVGGLNVNDAILKILPTTSGSTERMRRFFAARRLIEVLAPIEGSNQTLSLTVERHTLSGNQTLTIPVSFKVSIYPNPSQSAPPPAAPLVDSQVLPENIGYLRIDAFSNTAVALESAMNKLQSTDGLVIDVRKNGGGDQTGNVVLARLIASKINRYSISPRLSPQFLSYYPGSSLYPKIPGTDFAQWMENPVTRVGAGHFQGKQVVVLTSANCFSACDTFVSALKTYGLAKVVGDGTGGGTGSPLVFGLPFTKHRFRYSVIRGQTHQGNWIEGVGTLADAYITASPQDRANNQDVQLFRAVEIAKGRSISKNVINQLKQKLGGFKDGQNLLESPIEIEQKALELSSF